MASTAHQNDRIGLMVIDSGAHSLYTAKKMKAGDYSYFDSPQFWRFVDQYAGWIKTKLNRYGGEEPTEVIDYYVNVDVIFEPERSWKVLKHLEEEHGLSPMPVIHYGAGLEWFDKHIEAGYKFIGIGGLGQEVKQDQYKIWADKVYRHLCPKRNDFKPVVRTHGFAMTAFDLVTRYPWWSVDSASWLKSANNGNIYVPQTKNEEFDFGQRPIIAPVSNRTKSKPPTDDQWTAAKRWLREIEVPLGKIDDFGDEVERGVITHYLPRQQANLHYFQRLFAWLPEWPWRFII